MVSNENIYPLLNGLVLVGGKSQRMGIPKEKIQWYDKEQCYYLVDLLKAYCKTVYISCRAEQEVEMSNKLEGDQIYKFLPDVYANIGPLGGILTAFDLEPNRAWLVLACDMPLIDSATIDFLIQRRDSKKIATAFTNPLNGLPEPLCTIWEPKGYAILKQLIAQNKLSPRQALIQQQVSLIGPRDANILTNVNTQDEARYAKAIIANKSQGR
ncbi:MAG: hypothetical protein K0S24_937 [Sphingobacterium sp.]|jgi:molybdopterin-guanine dinucleotide biosynthesis protein A|nr:hypothetical protein [Sphingobacterium sp.]